MKLSPVSLPLTTYSLAGPITHSAQSSKADWPQSLVLGFLLWPLYTWPAHWHGFRSSLCWRPQALPAWGSHPSQLALPGQLQFHVSSAALPSHLVLLPSVLPFLSLNTTIHPVFQAESWKFSKGRAANSRACKLHHPGDEFIFYLRNECIGFNMVDSMQFPDVIPFNTQYSPRKWVIITNTTLQMGKLRHRRMELAQGHWTSKSNDLRAGTLAQRSLHSLSRP